MDVTKIIFLFLRPLAYQEKKVISNIRRSSYDISLLEQLDRMMTTRVRLGFDIHEYFHELSPSICPSNFLKKENLMSILAKGP